MPWKIGDDQSSLDVGCHPQSFGNLEDLDVHAYGVDDLKLTVGVQARNSSITRPRGRVSAPNTPSLDVMTYRARALVRQIA
jgi:hypothetical protein